MDAAYLEPNAFVDSDHPLVIDYAHRHGIGDTPTAQAIALYTAIRDGFRYTPYRVKLTPEAYRASTLLTRPLHEGGHCIDKANLLAACARVLGIPSRLHFANVRNHIATERLEAVLGTDLMVYHGYCELYLNHSWVAATPAFNADLCHRLGVEPLEFDGVHDSIFQAYDRSGGDFMEYVTDHGHHPDIPFDHMISQWKTHYPSVRSGNWPTPEAV